MEHPLVYIMSIVTQELVPSAAETGLKFKLAEAGQTYND
jgi:hypothetical protein